MSEEDKHKSDEEEQLSEKEIQERYFPNSDDMNK